MLLITSDGSSGGTLSIAKIFITCTYKFGNLLELHLSLGSFSANNALISFRISIITCRNISKITSSSNKLPIRTKLTYGRDYLSPVTT